jgi:ATP-binding cassette, subfamily B, multidrug efflux pump
LLRGIFLYWMRQTIIVMSRKIEYDQKAELYGKYQSLSLNFYKKNYTGDLMSRLAEDVSRVRTYTGPGIMYTLNLITLFVFVLIAMLRVNVELTLFTLTPLPILGLTIYIVNSMIEKKSERIQRQLSYLTTTAQETFSGIRVIKSYARENEFTQYFARECEIYKKRNLDLARLESIYFPAIFVLVGLSILFAVFIGGKLVINHSITPGVIAEFILYVNMLTWPIASVGWVMALIQRASASQKRIDEFLDSEADIISSSNKKFDIHGDIVFKNVSFTYPNTGITALKSISFTLKKGQKMAVIGRVGSGKSSLAQLIVRMYDPTEGSISIDGQNIRDVNLFSLRKQIGYVPQDVFLFSETVENNIAFGLDEPDFTKVKNAAKRAGIDSDIANLPQTYDTLIGERGVTLSGGQKQRISIARALIKDTPIIVFDDCLSSVDAKTEQSILENLRDNIAQKTAIIITHRIFSLIHFDTIIVLDEGKIAEQGTHKELIAKGGVYAELYEMQTVEEKKYTLTL